MKTKFFPKIIIGALLISLLIFPIFTNTEAQANCTHGGPGTASCSVQWSLFYGLFSGGCSIQCQSGYYACCHMGNNSCECVSNNTPQPPAQK